MAFQIKYLRDCFGTQQLTLKFIWKSKYMKMAKKMLKRNNEEG